MEMDVSNAERRPHSYWFADGIPDLVVGGVMFVTAGLWLVGLNLPRRPSIWVPFWFIVPVVLTALGLLERRIVRWLKARITDPRTGHIDVLGPSKRAWLVGQAFALLLMALILYSVATGKGLARLPIDAAMGYGMPVLLGAVFALFGVHSRRYLVLAGICFACVLLGYLGKLGFPTFLWSLLAVGVAQVSSGAFRLRRYLGANPRTRVST